MVEVGGVGRSRRHEKKEGRVYKGGDREGKEEAVRQRNTSKLGRCQSAWR